MNTSKHTQKKSIVFTGGGSGGHVYPNFPIIDALYEKGEEIIYIGSRGGIEEGIVAGNPQIGRYIGIHAGKLRRSFELKNILKNLRDILYILYGFLESFIYLLFRRPKFIYSKGGFVSVPVVWSGWLLGIPVYIHEADMTPGLANRLCISCATHIFLSFPHEKLEKKYGSRISISGLPLRKEVLGGDRVAGREFLGISKSIKPVLLVLGGSLGSENLNNMIHKNLPNLLEIFTVVHCTGKGKYDESVKSAGYIQKEYVGAEMGDVLASADMIVSRAGAGALFEALAQKIPVLLIPLSSGSRGEQISNAKWVQSMEYGDFVLERECEKDSEVFEKKIKEVWQKRDVYRKKLSQRKDLSPVEHIISCLDFK